MTRKLFLAIIVASLFVGACSKQEGGFSQRAQSGKESTFRYPIVTSPTTLDPHKVEDGDTIDLLQQIFEPLVRWDENSKPVPGLSDKWEIADSGKTWIFSIRKGVKFHNGREITADDVKWSLERCTNPKLASPVAATYLGDIVGVKEKLAGSAKEVSGIKVLDGNRVSISITRPLSFFHHKLTYLVTAVLPKESVPADAEITKVEQMVGTGPFKAKSYETDQLFTLTANKDYWDGTPKVESIERPIIKDAATRLNKYKNGDVDLVMLERQDVAALQKDPKYKDNLQFFDRPAIWYVGMAPNHYAPFQNRDVRRAFAMAIDTKTIVDETLGGINRIANGILPPAVVGHRENAQIIPFDPTAAKALLAKAGYPDGKGLPPLEFNYRDSRRDVQLVAEAVAAQLLKNLNVKATLRSMEWGAYLQKRDQYALELYHMRWAADYLDPENFLTTLLTTNGPENKSGYSNLEVDKLCAEADIMTDGPERNAKYAQAEDLILQDAVWVPVYFQRDAELIASHVKDLKESVFGHLPHKTVSLTPRSN